MQQNSVIYDRENKYYGSYVKESFNILFPRYAESGGRRLLKQL
jgi:hypothetical protein